MNETVACSECIYPGGIRVTKQGRLHSHNRIEPCPGSRQRPTGTGGCHECMNPYTPTTKQGVLQDHGWGVKCPGSGGLPAGGVTAEGSARITIENLWDRSTPVPPLLDRYRDETHKANAATVRAAKVREPGDETERHLNAVLEDLAVKIEGPPMLDRLDVPIFMPGCSGHRKGRHKFRNRGNYTVQCVRCETTGVVVPAGQAADLLDEKARQYLHITPEDVAAEIQREWA